MDITVSCTLDHPLNLQPIGVYPHQCPRSLTLLALGQNAVKIGCNRALLSVHCRVFEAMFESAMLESSENVVKIPDIDPVVFMSMLQWMSTNTLNIASICSLDDLIKLADRYQIAGLLSSCSLFLRSFTLTIHVVTDSILQKFHGVDLGLQCLKEMAIRLRILAYSSISDVIRAIGKQLRWRAGGGGDGASSIELWRVSNRKNGTTRPNRYLSPTMDDDAHRLHHRRKREVLKQEFNEHRDGNGSGNGSASGLALDDELEDDLDDDDDDENGIGNGHPLDHDDADGDDEDAAMDLLDENGCAVLRASSMRCHECHKQQYDRKRSKSNKKMDWNQYSGDSPTKAIYARFCSATPTMPNAVHSDAFGFAPTSTSNAAVASGHGDDGDHKSSEEAVAPQSQSMMAVAAQSQSVDVSVSQSGANGKNFRNSILLFLKYYDVYHEYLTIVGSILVDKHGPVSLICDAIRQMARWGEEHEIVLWEEEDCGTNKINAVEIGQSIADSSLVDGDIIVFQEKSNIFSTLQLKDAKTFLTQHSPQRHSPSSPRHGGGGGGGGGSGGGGGGGGSGQRGRRMGSANNHNHNGGGGGGGQHPGNGGMRGMANMVDADDF